MGFKPTVRLMRRLLVGGLFFFVLVGYRGDLVPVAQAHERAVVGVVVPPDSPWSSVAACERALAARKGHDAWHPAARIGTWNVRFYPDGAPFLRRDPHRATDIAWLACGIAWLDVDVLAVQEFKRNARARRATRELLSRLDHLTGGRWAPSLDDCPNDSLNHVGFLYDQTRVEAHDFRRVARFNPKGDACDAAEDPGWMGDFDFRNGIQLSLVAVHMVSGDRHEAHALRRKSWVAFKDSLALAENRPVMIAGDLNTAGCNDCTPRVTANAEIASMSGWLANSGFQLVPADARCSEYWGDRPFLLDHFALARGASLPVAPRAHVAGFCAAVECTPFAKNAMPAAFQRLSDHCPVLLDIGAPPAM